jgi:hypothetical protein
MMVLESSECSEERKWLVRRLIELRLRVQEIREASDKRLFETQLILGHHFIPQKYYITKTGSIYCDQCSGTIWIMLQSWYKCNGKILSFKLYLIVLKKFNCLINDIKHHNFLLKIAIIAAIGSVSQMFVGCVFM